VIGVDGVLKFRDRVCIPRDVKLKSMIIDEGHKCKTSEI